MATGPTGDVPAAVADVCQDGSSWLKDLIVVAIKIDGEHYGTSSTQLYYTMTSAATALTTAPSLPTPPTQ